MKQENAIGRVIKIVSNRYTVRGKDGVYLAYARGKIKTVHELFVGDEVRYSVQKPHAVIEEVLPRKTVLTRPYVANVTTALIVIAKEPEPDLLLVDKIILNCFREGIKPVLVYNKCELDGEREADNVFKAYSGFMECRKVSAETGEGIADLKDVIENQLTCLAGQSAVGKTSILNALLGLSLKTDGLSKRVMRGKNTTRHVEIFEAFGGEIADTCGFSMFEIAEMKPEELRFYYEDFLEFSPQCRFTRCEHIGEPDCAVKKAVCEGTLDRERYERYKIIYNELKEFYKKKYE